MTKSSGNGTGKTRRRVTLSLIAAMTVGAGVVAGGAPAMAATSNGTSFSAANSATSIYNHGKVEIAYIYANTGKTGILFSIPKGNTNALLVGNGNDNIESGYYQSYN